jgi:hypothetical protein
MSPSSTTVPLAILNERLTPALAVLAGLGLWFVMYVLAPVVPRWPQEFYPIGLFILCTFGLLAGLAIPEIMKVEFAPAVVDPEVFRSYFRLIFILATIGLVAKLSDVFLIRGMSVSASAAERDLTMRIAESGPLSIVAAVLLPLGQATLLLAAIGKKLGILPRIGTGRSSLFLLAVEALAAALLLVPRITARHVVWTGAVAVILLVSSSLIFASRMEFLGMDYRMSARYSVYTITVPANADYLDLLDSAHGSIGPLLASAVSLLQYFIHGVFEFFYLVELKSDNFTYGDTIFFFVSKMTSYLTGGATALSTLEIDARNPRGGTFQSFFGPAYVDFGQFVVLFCLVFGVFVGLVRRAVVSGNVYAFPLYIFLLMNLLIIPCVSGLLMYAGSISLMVYIGLWPLGTWWQRLRAS